MLNERNGHPLSAIVLEQVLAQTRANTTPRELEALTLMIASYRLAVFGANVALGYPTHDRTLHVGMPNGVDPAVLAKHPNDYADAYLRARSLSLAEFVGEVRRELLRQP